MRRRNDIRSGGGGCDWSRADAYQPRTFGKRSGGNGKCRPPRDGGGGGGGRWWRYSPLYLGAIFIGLVVGIGPSGFGGAGKSGGEAGGVNASPSRASGQAFGSCHVGGGYNCVVDGDTLYVQGVKIRVADIDAPETHEPKCPSEKALGDRATIRLRQLVNSGTVTLSSIDRDEDRYGRKLRIVKVDGVSVGDTLVSDGLARWYAGGRRPWC